jgi:hypothetical protein
MCGQRPERKRGEKRPERRRAVEARREGASERGLSVLFSWVSLQ